MVRYETGILNQEPRMKTDLLQGDGQQLRFKNSVCFDDKNLRVLSSNATTFLENWNYIIDHSH